MFYKPKTLEEQVNTKGTKLWVQMNQSTKAVKLRKNFIEKYGGVFLEKDGEWLWTNPIKEKNGYWLKRVDTEEKVFFENMSEFGKKYGLTPVKICELLNGKRKTYKGWTAVELRAVKEGSGSHEKIKEKKVNKIQIKMGAVLVNTKTNEILNISCIADYARENKLDYANLRKLATGKSKTYKNLKLYNPLENYKVTPEPK
jgi:hypothetical protein